MSKPDNAFHPTNWEDTVGKDELIKKKIPHQFISFSVWFLPHARIRAELIFTPHSRKKPSQYHMTFRHLNKQT